MRFLRNAWYVAAWRDEIGTALFARRLLDEPLLIYRELSGRMVALADLCPHRFVPLHMGRRHGDAIECAYHGLRFGSNGACGDAPAVRVRRRIERMLSAEQGVAA